MGGAVLKLFVSSFGVTDQTGGLGTNAYDNGAINMAGAFVFEVLLTAAFVGVILLVTERVAAPGFAGIAIGLTLTLVHLVGIPLTGTSVNPARSFGPASFAGGDALGQVWLFILAPLVGGGHRRRHLEAHPHCRRGARSPSSPAPSASRPCSTEFCNSCRRTRPGFATAAAGSLFSGRSGAGVEAQQVVEVSCWRITDVAPADAATPPARSGTCSWTIDRQ